MKPARIICFLLAGLFFQLLSITAFNQTKSDQLLQKRISISMRQQPFGKVVGYLIKNYDIAFGLEESLLDADHHDFDFETNLITPFKGEQNANGQFVYSATVEPEFEVAGHWITVAAENAKLEDVLDKIVSQMKN